MEQIVHNPPTEAEIEAASAQDRLRRVGSDEIERVVGQQIAALIPLHRFWLSRDENAIHATLFVEREAQISEFDTSANRSAINDMIVAAANEVVTANRAWEISIEFDSHENVLKNYEGSYFFRTR